MGRHRNALPNGLTAAAETILSQRLAPLPGPKVRNGRAVSPQERLLGAPLFTGLPPRCIAQARNFRRGRRAVSPRLRRLRGLVQRAVQSEATASRAGRRAASAPCKESLAAQGFSLAPHRSLLAMESQGLRPLTIPERLFRQAGSNPAQTGIIPRRQNQCPRPFSCV